MYTYKKKIEFCVVLIGLNNTESNETDSKIHYRNGNLDGYRCSTFTLQPAKNIYI